MNLITPDLRTVPRLHRCVSAVDSLLKRTGDEATILADAGHALAELTTDDDWLPDLYARPSPQRYQQFLLFADPDNRFSVVSFVWGPGQSTPIHDHTVWGLVSVLRGAEISQMFGQDDRGHWVPTAEPIRMEAGQVEAVSPTIGDVHRVANALHDRPSVSIHIYGADIGTVRRHVFEPDGTVKEFVSGYSNPTAADLMQQAAADGSPR